MIAIELRPPNYSSDWVSTFIDPGGFLEPYKRMPAGQRAQDLLIEEPTGDVYWESEYFTKAGKAKFRCGFIVHFRELTRATTEIQVYEKVPEVWVGEKWDFARHGIGLGRFHDIQFVEPTVKDRLDLLNLIIK
jgi:hypothetical protein